MGTSFGTVWSPTSIIFLLIMMLFLEAGGIFPCVSGQPLFLRGGLRTLAPAQGGCVPASCPVLFLGKTPRASVYQCPCCSDSLSWLFYSQSSWPWLVPSPLPGHVPCLAPLHGPPSSLGPTCPFVFNLNDSYSRGPSLTPQEVPLVLPDG